MEAITLRVPDLLMLVLSIFALGGESEEFRIDGLFSSGMIDTLYIKKVDDVFVAYDEAGGKFVEVGKIVPIEDEEGSYDLTGLETFVDGGKQRVILKDLIGDLDKFKASLKEESKVKIVSKDGWSISVERSGEVIYLIDRSPHRKCFYIAHAD